jgi:chromosome segregation ATPase
MDSNANDCSSIEDRINEHNLYLSTTQDQINKLDPLDPDIENKRDALTRKVDSLQEQVDALQHTLEDCHQGKGSNFPTFEVVSES